jgi:hypothetical protein
MPNTEVFGPKSASSTPQLGLELRGLRLLFSRRSSLVRSEFFSQDTDGRTLTDTLLADAVGAGGIAGILGHFKSPGIEQRFAAKGGQQLNSKSSTGSRLQFTS